MADRAKILVLGATGHIGRAACAALVEAACEVHGLARAPGANTRSQPDVHWHYADVTRMAPDELQELTRGCRAIVNAAGALQNGYRDRLEAIHVQAVAGIARSCPADCLIVHISAPGVSERANTDFFRTKHRGDQAVRTSGRPWVIFRPAVVLGRDAYGGSALLRALAAFPLAIPAVSPQSEMQTVWIGDVTRAIVNAVSGHHAPGTDICLAEAQSHTLADILRAHRQWLGMAPAPVVAVPALAARVTAFLADVTGLLGWRSPLRSTALAVAVEGVVAESGIPCLSLAETLALNPATVADRWFARLYLVKPIAILVLSVFWIASGLVGLTGKQEAARHLISAGFEASSATAMVVGGSLADLALGTLMLLRRWARLAILGMAAVTLFYIAAATAFVPELWLDPLGPLVKTIPGLGLILLTAAILEER